jgi:ketosteroid isomerase-like protein
VSARPSDVVRRYFETFAHSGLDEAAGLWHADIEWRTLEADKAGVIRGRDGMRLHYEEWVDTMDALTAEAGEIAFEDDERVALQVRNSGRGRVSGVPASGSYYVACLVRDGRIVRAEEHATREEAVGAAQAL